MDVGYEQLICHLCGEERIPRPTGGHAVPCSCGGREFRRRSVLALEQDELELLIELAEFQGSSRIRDVVLEKLYAEQRFEVAA